MILENCVINGLPHDIYRDTTLNFSKINYFFGANGSGKTLTLKNIIAQARQKLNDAGESQKGNFVQYIGAMPQNMAFYASDTYQLIEDPETRDRTGDLAPEVFYQHLFDHPEIITRIQDSLQRYLGRHPNIVRKNVNNVMSFLREDDSEIPSYSPAQESDGLKRLSLLLAYVYHPKCVILGIDEPELHLHPDMVSFLLEEIKDETQYGKQFFFATHSPEIIEIGAHDTYAYFYFDLHDKLKESKIIDAHQVGAQTIMEELGVHLDVNRRAFLFAPITLFAEGINDEYVFNRLKKENKVVWPRRVFTATLGGVGQISKFVELWKRLNKNFTVIMDAKVSENDAPDKEITKLCTLFSIAETTYDQKKIELAKHNIFIASYPDVLCNKTGDTYTGKIDLETFKRDWGTFDLSDHIEVLNKALSVEKELSVVIRKSEEEWLQKMLSDITGLLSNSNEATGVKLAKIKQILESRHPRLSITVDPDASSYLSGRFKISRFRDLVFIFSKDSAGHQYRAVKSGEVLD